MKKGLLLMLSLGFVCAAFAQPLELTLKKGNSYTQQLNSKSTVTQQINGMSMEINVDLEMKMTFKILDIKQDSLYNTEVCYNTMKMAMHSQFMNTEMSSESTDPNDKISSIMKSFVNKPFTITISKTGKIYEITVDTLINSVINEFGNLQPQEKAAAKQQFGQSFSGNALKTLLENNFSIYTGKVEKVGSTWEKKTSVNNGMIINTENTYEVVDIKDGVYTIKNTGTASTEEGAVIEQNGMKMKYSINGSIDGETKIEIATGWIVAGSYNQALKGQAEIEANAQMPDGMTIPMTITSNNVISK